MVSARCCICWYLIKLGCLAQSSSLPVPDMHMMFSLSSTPWFYNICHHGLLTCKSCNTISLALSGTSASLGSDMDHGPISYRSCTIVLLLGMNLAFLFHVMECWTFILMVSFCPACGTPNDFPFVLVLVLV
jgi:hypothetical protein